MTRGRCSPEWMQNREMPRQILCRRSASPASLTPTVLAGPQPSDDVGIVQGGQHLVLEAGELR